MNKDEMELEEAIKMLRECKVMDVCTTNYDLDLMDYEQAIKRVLQELEDKEKKIDKVLNIIFEYGQIDEGHHKAWVIDQIVRILQGDNYKNWVYDYKHDKETGEKYSWDIGIAP